MADQKLTQLTALAAFPADPANLLVYVVDLTEAVEDDQSKKAALALIDTRYQPLDADLTTIAGLAKADGNFIVGDGAAWVVESGATVRASLGLGSLAVINSPLPIINGGSGQVTQQAAIDALTNVAAATNEYVLTKDTATGNAVFKVTATVLPVVDETPLVYKTGTPANTLTFDVTAYTAPRVVTWPDAAMTVAGLQVANVFTTTQTIPRVTNNGLVDIAVNAQVGGVVFVERLASINDTYLGVNAAEDMIFHLSNAGGAFRFIRVSAGGANVDLLSLSATALTLDSGVSVSLANINITGAYDPTSATPTGLVFRNVGGLQNDVVIGRTAANALAYRTASGQSHKFYAEGAFNQTTAVTIAAEIISNLTTNAPAAGFGSSLRFGLESDTTDDQSAGRLIYKWTTAAHLTRKAQGSLTAYDTAERECIRWEANGAAAMLGFFGVNAVIQPATSGTVAGFTAGVGTGVNDDSTFDGGLGGSAYTIGDAILALKQLGVLAP